MDQAKAEAMDVVVLATVQPAPGKRKGRPTSAGSKKAHVTAMDVDTGHLDASQGLVFGQVNSAHFIQGFVRQRVVLKRRPVGARTLSYPRDSESP